MAIIPTIPREVLRKAFLITNGSFWFLTVFCAMYLASEVWRFYHTVFFVNAETVRRAVTGVLVLATLIAYIVGLIGCCVGMRINRNSMILYLLFAAAGILVEIPVIILLFAGSEMSLQMTTVASTFWTTAGRDIQTLIQFELHCCGFESPDDFGTEKPGVSCYEILTDGDMTEYKPYTVGCRSKMESILSTRWGVLRVFCAVIAIVQVFGVISGSSILLRIRPAPKTGDEKRKQQKPKLKYNPIKNTSKMTDGAPTTGVTTGQSPEEGDVTPQGDTTPTVTTRMSPEEGGVNPQGDTTPTVTTRKSPEEGDMIGGVTEDTPASGYDDTAPLVTADTDTTPAPDNDTEGNTPAE